MSRSNTWPTISDWPILTEEYQTRTEWANQWWTAKLDERWYTNCPKIEIVFEKGEQRYDRESGLIYRDSLTGIDYEGEKIMIRSPWNPVQRKVYGLYYKRLSLGGESVVLLSLFPNAWFSDGWISTTHSLFVKEIPLGVLSVINGLVRELFKNERIIHFWTQHEEVFYLQRDQAGPDILFVDRAGKVHAGAMFWDETNTNEDHIYINETERFLVPDNYIDPTGKWADSQYEYLAREHRLQHQR